MVMDDVRGREPSFDTFCELTGIGGGYIGNLCLSQPARILRIMELVHDQKDLMSLSHQLCAKIRYVGCLTIFVEASGNDNSQE
mgnify:CR=1 FL=1